MQHMLKGVNVKILAMSQAILNSEDCRMTVHLIAYSVVFQQESVLCIFSDGIYESVCYANLRFAEWFSVPRFVLQK